jgi:hypothetical protein
VPAALRAGFARTALLDLDPGLFQIWARDHDLGVGSHDAHLTIGVNLGAADCPVPSDAVAWRTFWPLVHVPSWSTETDAPSEAPYTSVTQWWTNQYAVLDGVAYDGNKRTGWLACVELPSRTKARLELAANLHAGEVEDRALLARHGWRLVDPARVAGDPQRFRAYVQASRGELCCAKPAFVRTRSGWLSDRTVCYLASGRPCVTEATGAERHLPPCSGLRFFHTVDEAADALEAVETDRAEASRASRVLAEEVFSARTVLPGVLAAAEGRAST